jgi:hypothetical protein
VVQVVAEELHVVVGVVEEEDAGAEEVEDEEKSEGLLVRIQIMKRYMKMMNLEI